MHIELANLPTQIGWVGSPWDMIFEVLSESNPLDQHLEHIFGHRPEFYGSIFPFLFSITGCEVQFWLS